MLQSWRHAGTCITCYSSAWCSRNGLARLAGPSSRSAGLHTSTPLAKGAATSLTAKRTHEAERAERRRERASNAPHVVLGTRPGEEHKWEECDLARCIMTEAQIRAATKIVPGYGVSPGSAEERLLFTALPTLSAEMSTAKLRQTQRPGLHLQSDTEKADASSALVQELGVEGAKVEHLRKLLDLRNANAASIAYENRRRCVQEFSAPDKPDDTGRVEVQGMG
jgi:small subunit ribosomal protein S15